MEQDRLQRYCHGAIVGWLIGCALLTFLVDWSELDPTLRTFAIFGWFVHGAFIGIAYTAEKEEA